MNYHLKKLSGSSLVNLRQFSLNVGKTQKKNHYDSLGITPKATQGDIKNAYYKLSKQYHPDINSGNESAADKFRDIAEAYEVLGNLKARKLYDRGVSLKDGSRYDSQSDERVTENYKHAPFYHQRNKPSSTKSALSGKTRHYDMDEWTKAHYSETFAASRVKNEEGRIFVKDKIVTKKENILYSQLFGLLIIIMGCGIVYETDASRKYDKVNVERPTAEENPD